MRIAFVQNYDVTLSDFTHWNFEPSGDYAADCKAGKSLARRYLEFRQDTCFGPSLGWIVQAIATKGQVGSGLAVGFLHALSASLSASPAVIRRPQLTVIDGGKAGVSDNE